MNYSSLHISTNFHIIKKWIEERGGKPTRLKNLPEDSLTSLSVWYPSMNEEDYLFISWQEFFDEFVSLNLAFMYQDDVEEGEHRMFYKLVRCEDYIDELAEEEDAEDEVLEQEFGLLNF